MDVSPDSNLAAMTPRSTGNQNVSGKSAKGPRGGPCRTGYATWRRAATASLHVRFLFALGQGGSETTRHRIDFTFGAVWASGYLPDWFSPFPSETRATRWPKSNFRCASAAPYRSKQPQKNPQTQPAPKRASSQVRRSSCECQRVRQALVQTDVQGGRSLAPGDPLGSRRPPDLVS
jgi:hypothetical protein